MPRKAKRRPQARQQEQNSHVQEEAVPVPSDCIRPEKIAISKERLDDINGLMETKNKSDRHAAQCMNRLQLELADSRESLECCVCLERPIRSVISPCGHCVCGHEKCGSANLQECPVCRGRVNHMTKMFGPGCAISNALDICQKLTEQISVSNAEASSPQGPFMALAFQWRIRFDQVSGLRKDNDELNSTVGEKCLDIFNYKNQITDMECKRECLRNAFAANIASFKDLHHLTEQKSDKIEALESESRLLKRDLAQANKDLEILQEQSEKNSDLMETPSSEVRQLKEELTALNKEKEQWRLSNLEHTRWMLSKFDKFKEKHAWLKHTNRFLAKQLHKIKAPSDRGLPATWLAGTDERFDVVEQKPEPMQVVVDGMLMKLLAKSPDGGTVFCCANKTLLRLVDSDFMNLYEANMPGVITAASFHPEEDNLFLQIDNRTLIFDLKKKKYRETD